MGSTITKQKTVKDLTISEFESLVRKVIADDIESWRETFEVMGDRSLMSQIRKAERSFRQGRVEDYIPWEDLKRCV